jgi:putative FmdB family regulatory protein
MPTYQYHCTKCEHEFEKVQSMSDKALTVCPKELCGMKKWGKGPLKKLISAGAGLIFKGSGFYITDYRSDKYKEAAKKDAPATASTSDAKSGESKVATPAKTESKPAKTETKPAPKASS